MARLEQLSRTAWNRDGEEISNFARSLRIEELAREKLISRELIRAKHVHHMNYGPGDEGDVSSSYAKSGSRCILPSMTHARAYTASVHT